MQRAVTDSVEKNCLNNSEFASNLGSTKPNSTKLTFATRGNLALALLSALLLVSIQPAHAQTETLLYSFGSQSGDGIEPSTALVLNSKGTLYGTTISGGTANAGTVFKLTLTGKETVLYSIGSQAGDGVNPYGGLIMDKKGTLYGTTVLGGAYGGGTVFKVTSAGKESVLYSFGSQSGDGNSPWDGLIMDAKGTLYGTTAAGGAKNAGTVFKLTSTGKESVLYSFGTQSGDGSVPYAGVILDNQGNIYGTTNFGGAHGSGTIFKLTSRGKERVLYSFCAQQNCDDGNYPYAGLIRDRHGNLFGTTIDGGVQNNSGAVFELTAAGKENLLYSFVNGGDGLNPYAGLVMDKKGNLYGASLQGSSNAGAAFELSPGKAGVWTFTVLHDFTGGKGDGANPYGTPVLDKHGNLYGTTEYGGTYGNGTVYKLTP